MKAAKLHYLKTLLVGTFIIFLAGSSQIVFAQETEASQPADLSGRFKALKDESESYNEYKVIKTYKLNTFWKEVEDSLNGYRNDVDNAHAEIAQLNNKIDLLTQELAGVKNTLAESEARNSTIAFLGIEINKGVYNTIVWAIIAGLIFLTISMFIAFKNNHVLTKKAKKDYKDVLHEFEEYRKTSREKQMKLGRELQTERNKLEDLKTRMGKSEKMHSK